MRLFIAYGGVLLVMAALDAVWLGFFAKQFYADRIGHLYAESVRWAPVLAFYAIYAAAVIYFAVVPGGTVWDVALRGAVLGFVAYMTYDLTNFATLKDWPLSVVLADIGWGAFITGIAALAGSFLL